MAMEKLAFTDLISKTEAECIRLNYGATTLENFKDTWLALQRYGEIRGELYYHEQLAAQFLKDLYGYPEDLPKSRTAHSMIRALRVLGDFRMFGRLTTWKTERKTPSTDDFRIAVDGFVLSCQKRNNSEETITRRMWVLNKFLDHLTLNGIFTCSDITPEHISSFAASLAHLSRKGSGRYLECLRMFFRSLYLSGQCKDDLSFYVPKLYYPKSNRIPTVWSADELSRILSVIDRGNATGKRNYCIILLVVRCGIRTGDVKNLRLENFDWEHGYIEFVQHKTSVPNRIPIPEDVGIAIIDYLQHGRPQTDDPHVFVKHIMPYDGIASLTHIFYDYLIKAGIKSGERPGHGLHSLRHTLATRLLEEDVPLEVISSILGHTSLDSAKPYLKINVDKLRECALKAQEESEHE